MNFKSFPLQENDPNWARRRKSEYLSFPGKIRSALCISQNLKDGKFPQSLILQGQAQDFDLFVDVLIIGISRFTRTRSTEKGWWEKNEEEQENSSEQNQVYHDGGQ